MARKKKSNRRPPPCPDPELYEWVDGNPTGYWRKKRTKVVLNTGMKEGKKSMKRVSPFTRMIREQLKDFTKDLRMGRLGNRMNSLLFQSIREQERILPEYLNGLEFQKEHWLRYIMMSSWRPEHDSTQKVFRVSIPITKDFTIKKESKLLTGYQFTAILLYREKGSAKKPNMVSTGSQIYKFTDDDKECVLELRLKSKPQWWLFILRAECYEGAISALHHRHKGMAVIDGGGVVE